jgi:hypothetical protein
MKGFIYYLFNPESDRRGITPEMSESMIRGAIIHLMLRCLAKLQAQAS